ncbi:hypothetical protein RSJ42_18025 [Methanosarcina hadiensis]|uniref:hypothetical protein n=1 Tax=Methanosarcina hadiensis TaxID=3078083 RepID=UPI00397744CE
MRFSRGNVFGAILNPVCYSSSQMSPVLTALYWYKYFVGKERRKSMVLYIVFGFKFLSEVFREKLRERIKKYKYQMLKLALLKRMKRKKNAVSF